MSTTSPPPAATRPATSTPREIRIVSHSSLFYWWPVWAVGFIMAGISAFSDYRMAVIPEGTQAEVSREIPGYDGKRDILVLPPDEKLPRKDDGNPKPADEYLHMARSKNLGVLFCTVLLLVIAITNVPLRGLWSVIVIVFIVFLAIIFALLGWWATIVEYLGFLDIRINLGGYLFISLILFVLWCIIVFLYDKQIYMIFTPGQLRVHLEIGEGEIAYDTTGMTIQKQRSDLFRHWILGLGSGDLIVRTSGAQAHFFDLPNVLFLGRKVREIEDMLRQRQVVTS